MRPTFEQTVDVLVKAYLNDTLLPGWPCGCAVGNLIAHYQGLSVVLRDGDDGKEAYWSNEDEGYNWFYLLRPESRCMWQAFNPSIGHEQIESTGYTIAEIDEIEEEFELATAGGDIFAGLMAVVDVLADIHCVDLSVKENAKLLFVK